MLRKYHEGIWEIRGDSGERTLSEDEWQYSWGVVINEKEYLLDENCPCCFALLEDRKAARQLRIDEIAARAANRAAWIESRPGETTEAYLARTAEMIYTEVK